MRTSQQIRSFARRGRAVFLPIGSVHKHLQYLVFKTGKDLHFKNMVIKRLENETVVTLQESGIYK